MIKQENLRSLGERCSFEWKGQEDFIRKFKLGTLQLVVQVEIGTSPSRYHQIWSNEIIMGIGLC